MSPLRRHAATDRVGPLSRKLPTGSRARRAVAMIEFALVLPMFLFLIVFTIDMGHLILMSGSVQDATHTAARVGAQLGGAGVNTNSGGGIACGNGSRNCNSDAYRALTDTVAQIPTADTLGQLEHMEIATGSRCTTGGADDHVTLRVRYSTRLVTPGLSALLSFVSGKPENYESWNLNATAVARCEVVR